MERTETPVESVSAAVYVIPIESSESDGSLAWDSTTMIAATTVAADITGLGWTYGSPAVSTVIADHLAPIVAGGQVRADVPIYGSGGFICYDNRQTRQQLTGWVHDEQIPRVKIKIGECWVADERRDRARIALARDCIGPDTVPNLRHIEYFHDHQRIEQALLDGALDPEAAY